MGLTTFAISNVLFSLTHARRAALGVLARRARGQDVPALHRAAPLAAILLGTELGFLQRILNTVHLDLHQWLVCIVVGLAIVPVSEGRRLLLERRDPAADAVAEPSVEPAASSIAVTRR